MLTPNHGLTRPTGRFGSGTGSVAEVLPIVQRFPRAAMSSTPLSLHLGPRPRMREARGRRRLPLGMPVRQPSRLPAALTNQNLPTAAVLATHGPADPGAGSPVSGAWLSNMILTHDRRGLASACGRVDA
jgi:hypothetical protein